LNPQTRYLAVGTFLLFGVAALVFMIFWFEDRGRTTSAVRYSVKIDSEVNGLSSGSAVRFLGVNVGSVVDINLQTRPVPYVDVLIEIASTVPVDETTYATLAAQGITGIANVDLFSDPENPTSAIRNSDSLRIIPYRATGLSAVLSNTGNITAEAYQLLSRINAWSGQGNLERLTAILENMEIVTGELAEQPEKIPEILATISDMTKRLDHTAAMLESTVAEDLPVIAGDLKVASGSLADISRRADGWLVDNDANIRRLLGESSTAVADIVADLRDAASHLSGLTHKLDEQPSRLLYRSQQDPVVAEP